MNLIDKTTGKKLKGLIEIVSKKELKALKKNTDFSFDWNLEIENEILKIRLEKNKEILGLMSLIDFPEELRMHINIIESSTAQRGKDKSILNIPGCLIGYACKISFKKGYDGFVSLVSKTKLVKYYHQTYGFIEFGTHMAVFNEISESIIQKYFDDEEI